MMAVDVAQLCVNRIDSRESFFSMHLLLAFLTSGGGPYICFTPPTENGTLPRLNIATSITPYDSRSSSGRQCNYAHFSMQIYSAYARLSLTIA
jgi:hypothetical protein